MKIQEKYSHLNGEEFLIVHKKELYQEIEEVIQEIDGEECRTKISKEIKRQGNKLFSPIHLNKEFERLFNQRGWIEDRYSYYITLNRELMEQSILMEPTEQRKFLIEKGEDPIYSFNQTDFVKEKVSVEVQFGKYAFVSFDLFVKHMLFYTGNKIDVGIEIIPTKKMVKEMSSGIGYFEGEVYNLMRQGRTSPPVPLLVLGIEP
jgi:hypothetical protein